MIRFLALARSRDGGEAGCKRREAELQMTGDARIVTHFPKNRKLARRQSPCIAALVKGTRHEYP